MDVEDGLIWAFSAGDDGVMAFTDAGIETLIELLRTYKENPNTCSRHEWAFADRCLMQAPMARGRASSRF